MNTIFNLFRICIGSLFLFIFKHSNIFFIFNSIKYTSFEKYVKHLYQTHHKKLELIKKNETKEENELSCMSYNIHMGFDIFNNYKINQIINYINDLNCDFVCLQEILNEDQYFYIKSSLNYDYSYYGGDMCILSKYPIEKTKNIYYDTIGVYDNNNFVYCKINVNDTYINLLNIHLLNDIALFKQKREMKQIIEYLNIHLDQYKDKIILIGDFNYSKEFVDVYTYMFQKLHLSKSFPSIYPILSLDRMYCKNIKVKNYKIDDVYYSDHKPLVCDFNVNY